MPDYGAPPVIPAALQQYNSYVTDPIYQKRYTWFWVAALAFTVLYALLKSVFLSVSRRRRPYYSSRFSTSLSTRICNVLGVWEDWGGKYQLIPSSDEKGTGLKSSGTQVRESRRNKRKEGKETVGVFAMVWNFGTSFAKWSFPGLELDLGQILVIVAYMLTVILCVVLASQLIDNPNRAGFLAIAQLPFVFFTSLKFNPLSLISPSLFSYTSLNFLHRWSSRTLFICALLHGALWINNHLQYDLPILGQQKETSGVAAFGVLCGIVLLSLRWVRRVWWEGFFLLHILGYVAFFVTLCYHTIYAAPWIYPPIAFLAFDYLMRLVRFRVKDASLVAVDRNMTLIRLHDCDGGWKAGQHIRLRVFIGRKMFETHPLTIANAPTPLHYISDQDSEKKGKENTRGGGEILLAARVVGDWTKTINDYCFEERERLFGSANSPSTSSPSEPTFNEIPIPIQVMIDGPYGGLSIDLGEYENVLLVAGGSGASFTVGVLDEIVGRCCDGARKGGEKTRRIEFVWYMKSFGHVEWFAPMLTRIANTVQAHRARLQSQPDSDILPLDLHISVFVTCLCDPETVPTIPNSDICIERPTSSQIFKEFSSPPLPCVVQPKKRLSTIKEKGGESERSSLEIDTSDEMTHEGDLEQGEGGIGGKKRALKGNLDWAGMEGGVGVCVSGPEGLIREMGNAVAGASLRGGMGRVGLHTELFAL